jgi:phosphoribosylamine--glycine ligase
VKVLLVGSGGREHALAWKIAQSPRVDALYAAPGNPGIARHAKCVDLRGDAIEPLLEFAQREAIDLTVVGPELPLVAGLADRFAERGLAVFGPTARAAQLEGSKAYAKALMARHGIPTARFQVFDDADRARRYCHEIGAPLVVKADGLAAGKGVTVCPTVADAERAIVDCMERRAFGAAGARVVIEELLRGPEVSFFVIVSGKNLLPFAAAQDHKRVFDGDRGPNTGGMGAYSPYPPMDTGIEARVMREIVEPTIAALGAEGILYRGVLFVGLMLTHDGPRVIEFNCRFGDPECQAILVRAEGDLVPTLLAAARGDTLPAVLTWNPGAAVCVAVASRGYPGSYRTGLPIDGIEEAAAVPGVHVFHAGTAEHGGRLITAGGRVLAITALGGSREAARKAAYEAIGRVAFDGMHYRADIGAP